MSLLELLVLLLLIIIVVQLVRPIVAVDNTVIVVLLLLLVVFLVLRPRLRLSEAPEPRDNVIASHSTFFVLDPQVDHGCLVSDAR